MYGCRWRLIVAAKRTIKSTESFWFILLKFKDSRSHDAKNLWLSKNFYSSTYHYISFLCSKPVVEGCTEYTSEALTFTIFSPPLLSKNGKNLIILTRWFLRIDLQNHAVTHWQSDTLEKHNIWVRASVDSKSHALDSKDKRPTIQHFLPSNYCNDSD